MSMEHESVVDCNFDDDCAYDETDKEIDIAEGQAMDIDGNRIAALRDVLRDIAQGADMMLHPALKVTGALRGYIEEVKRVATEGARL